MPTAKTDAARRGALLIIVWVLLCGIWGSTWAFIKLGLRDLPPVTFVASRFLVAVILLLCIALYRRARLPRTRAEWWVLAASGVPAFTFNYGLLFWGERYVSSGLAAILQATIPLFGLLIAHKLLPEEPLTIAMALDEAGWLGRAPIEIRASDASTAAVEKARRGVYRARSFRNLPAHLRAKYFTQEGATQTWRVDAKLRAAIDWRVVNLMDEAEVAPLAAAHVIFCRNVFIYLCCETIRRTVRSFAAHIRPPGYLCVAAAESLLKLSTDFELQEVGSAFVYVRRPGAG